MHYVAIEESRRDLLKQLQERLDARLEPERAADVEAFARHFYATVPVEDLVDRRLDDLYGATLSIWQFLQHHDPQNPKVRIFNPDFEEHGWQSTHTFVAVLHEDMPFLVDSVRIELNRRGLTVHAIQNAVLAVARDGQHQLKALASPRDEDAPEARESLMVIEVDRHSDPESLTKIENKLHEVLRDVRTAVSDFDEMCGQITSAIQELEKNCPPQIDPDDHEEAIAFLEWLLKDNFTFLGYDEYLLEGKELQRDPNSVLGVFRLDQPRYRERIRTEEGVDENGDYVLVPQLLSFAKSAHHSRVHRPTYPDYITVDRYDDDGNVIGERRFFGLFTSTVYNESPRNIPLLRRKLKAVMDIAGFNPQGHNGKQLLQVLEVYPRDDLFQISTESLASTSLGILNIRERRQVRLFIRADVSGKFYSCLVFVPRDVFSTDLRQRIQTMLCDELDAHFGDFNTYLSESVLARIQLILRFNGEGPSQYDLKRLESKVARLARSWRDELQEAMIEGFGEERANHQMDNFHDAFSASYREDFNARTAVFDVQHLLTLDSGDDLSLSLYRPLEEQAGGMNLKLFHRETQIPLSDVLPMMENLGLRVIGERPYDINAPQQRYWIHDFELEHSREGVNLSEMRDTFSEAFKRIWAGEADNDAFNRLIIGAGLDWREVAMLRGYARYLKQIRFGMSQDYIAATLANYPVITQALVELFRLRFDPKHQPSSLDDCIARLNENLESVASLNDDQLLRRFMELIQATLRTNYYQKADDGRFKDYISYKLEPSKVTGMPKPRPAFEIFVCSPRVEGVHLRGGKVARGGLRWSDRHEDFRTEVLGLVKAQQVKNAVIVPVGAKGGFVCKRMPENADRETQQKEGIACYKIFIRALLDVTDNLVGGEVVPPQNVVRHDGDDSYLVVAADKGTATFSDIANEISIEYGHWLGDAFASGGANGYDHKKMAITARGAWESVKRHFKNLDVNTQQDLFTVVGIGDMAGDVFGNGMLLSDKIQLVGAFNHLHIFVDPNPDAEAAFAERKRMFNLPRSSWEDYNAELISQGGGVFSRSAKSIPITPEMQQVFGIEETRLSPNDLIRAMLKAKIDLLWNGGIGTYVKSSDETDADVGDKANDALRINGAELNCRVVGEGGNLGLTQRGRMEAAAKGVRVYTDFIDNAGGVNCSDHEVNIKILIDEVVKRGDMTDKQRNQLLSDMTEEVANLVILDNYRQTQALDLSEILSHQGMGPYRRFISELESAGQIDRELEFLPGDDVLKERASHDQGMRLPELSVLISYAKSTLKGDLINSDVPDDPYIHRHLERLFPEVLTERYQTEMYDHRLKREIVATQVANDLVDHMGIVFVRRLMDSTGAGRADIARAYVVARDAFNLTALWEQIEALDNQVPNRVQYSMMLDLMRMIRRATRWFLRQHLGLSTQDTIEYFGPRLAQLQEGIGELLSGEEKATWRKRCDELLEAGVPEALASTVAASPSLYAGLGIIHAARVTNEKPQRVAEVFYEIGSRLELPWIIQQVTQLEVRDAWQAQARETFRDDIDRQQLALTTSVLKLEAGSRDTQERVAQWLEQHAELHRRWCHLIDEVRGGSEGGFALFAVAVRELVDLAESDSEA
ncbi:NAD-glutamate dehydrogenase [Halomonas sp. XH26]|uniref:NAD-glutamate dehydrogenase n=1 Tax=Vreelandella alkaliphila TaxID=272774 RepID=A0AAJ2VS61_9GAMM|nr:MULTISPECIES: NAD-glutamate dehydrogenase [Halomonas]AIA75452.1 NAD-glutamate dehydrogenase [Halomonas campaniensis]AYF32423.1 NAD-glutamate dehydrogenase [Halomonas alkaliphila]MDX5979020.1 NAD-glutamate dehydrogenase [Halomonas alkaliphila]UTA80918.1 NAD-glutamate dehydrogenase [Halomonas sp. XH26]